MKAKFPLLSASPYMVEIKWVLQQISLNAYYGTIQENRNKNKVVNKTEKNL